MAAFEKTTKKIMSWAYAQQRVAAWKAAGEAVVFTNGCFDILHFGHLHYLAAAADLGQRLVIGLNSTESVRQLKGAHRPIQDAATRAHILAAFHFVDAVVVFSEETPFLLINTLQPDVLVKGGDYAIADIVGADMVLASGGKVEVLPFVEGYSTTNIEQKIKNNT